MNTSELDRVLADLESLEREATGAFDRATTPDEVERARITYLGQKHGRIEHFEAFFKTLDPAGKKAFGKPFNLAKGAIKQAHQSAKERVAGAGDPARDRARTPGTDLVRAASSFDFTLPGLRPRVGHKHPLTQTAEELIDIFGRFGFTVARGPEIEDEWHNFEALNIPPAHPARDPLENFYINEQTLLRSQTSTVQIRVMEHQPPPVRVVAIGRVYRPDTIDATHSCMFHQIEGLYVDTDVTLADLKTVLRLFAASYLGQDVHIRFRPSFFPFTEPSMEVDIQCDRRGNEIRFGEGNDWLEILGCGMVHPNVLKNCKLDPNEYQGFAWGMGIDRIAMLKYGMPDLRAFFEADVRWLSHYGFRPLDFPTLAGGLSA